MKTPKITLKPGQTVADLLDAIETATVKRLTEKHGMTEQNLRGLLTTEPQHEITASYHRKNARAKQALIAMGMNPGVFA